MKTLRMEDSSWKMEERVPLFKRLKINFDDAKFKRLNARFFAYLSGGNVTICGAPQWWKSVRKLLPGVTSFGPSVATRLAVIPSTIKPICGYPICKKIYFKPIWPVESTESTLLVMLAKLGSQIPTSIRNLQTFLDTIKSYKSIIICIFLDSQFFGSYTSSSTLQF